MIRDYEEGSGLKGVLQSLTGEKVAEVLAARDNTISIFFESGCAVVFRAWDHGTMIVQPLNEDEILVHIKSQIRDAKARLANLHMALDALRDCKSANK